MSDFLNSLFNKTKSFYHAKNLNTSKNGILITWIQNRLKEYFVAQKARELKAKKHKDFSLLNEVDQFDVECHKLKVLDVEVHHTGDEGEEWDKFIDIMMGIDPMNRPVRSEHESYRIGKSHITVTYKEDQMSPVKTLHLKAEAGQIEDMELVDAHPYYAQSEKHKIDVHTKVFPMLEDWMITRDIDISLSLPECYFGKSEECRKIRLDSLDQIISTENDIMSKVATGMELDKTTPVMESHRLLLLEDVEIEGFECKVTEKSKFLPFLNVQAALKDIAVIHCTTWAFKQFNGKPLLREWPFLNHSQFLPFIMTKAETGFPLFIEIAEAHLLQDNAQDKEQILSRFHEMTSSFKDIFTQVFLSFTGPTCLIHRCLTSDNILFRHTLINDSNASFYNNPITIPSIAESLGDQKFRTKSSRTTPRFSIPKLVNREASIVDWQNAGFGSPMTDVALLILTSLPPQTRKTHALELLEVYWGSFKETASIFNLKVPWTLHEIHREYYYGLLFGCIILASNAFPEYIPEEKEHVTVIIEAVRDLIQLKII